jgi:hypothetical protein
MELYLRSPVLSLFLLLNSNYRGSVSHAYECEMGYLRVTSGDTETSVRTVRLAMFRSTALIVLVLRIQNA